MTAKKWFGMLGLTLLLIAVLFALFNIVVDPFGVFGDRFFTWWSFDMTNNPRAAKIGYLESLDDNPYDSYIIGCSSTSSFPVETLNAYYDANFYNMIMYGADMQVTEDTVRYLFETAEVKNLVLNVYIDNGIRCGSGAEDITYFSHEKVSGESKLAFYSRYLFADPRYAFAKLRDLRQDTYLQQSFDVFDIETGAYDKSLRDIEPIGDTARYLQSYPVFANYPKQELSLAATDACMASIARIAELCREHGANFLVLTAPVYIDYFDNFDRDEVEYFYTRLAETTPFWDFSISSVSREPRYFYDDTHFRNSVGDMALARIFGGELYIPEDFGIYVTPDNVADRLESIYSGVSADTYTAEVPILMYHHVAEQGEGTVTVSTACFEEQIRALAEAGYTALTFDDLDAFVNNGTPLPEKSVLITFDDGYESNYSIAYPILEKYGMKATIFTIGVSVGKDSYKETGKAMTPHFTYEQAAEMVRNGVISVQSHGYDLHQVEGYDAAPLRQGAGMLPGESEDAYIAFLRDDFSRSASELEAATGERVHVLAYPYGKVDNLTAVLLSELGVTATLGDTTDSGINTIVAGLPQSLYGLRRLNVDDSFSGEALLEAIAVKTKTDGLFTENS